MNGRYIMQWPRDGLDFTCYAHEIMNFRYNWHEQEYELNIVLKGSAEYCRGGSMHVLHEDDLILIDPAVGHASFALDQHTVALVLRFPAGAFRDFVKPEQLYSFPGCVCGESDRFVPRFNRIRFQHALFELATTQKPFTQVAIDNGFPDLKSFNNRFTETFGRRPAEYLSQVSPEQTVKQITQMNYLDPSLPLVRDKLDAYTRLAADGTGG